MTEEANRDRRDLEGGEAAGDEEAVTPTPGSRPAPRAGPGEYVGPAQPMDPARRRPGPGSGKRGRIPGDRSEEATEAVHGRGRDSGEPPGEETDEAGDDSRRPAARGWGSEALEAVEAQDTLETREPPPAPAPGIRGRGQRRARPTAGLSAVDQVRKAEFPVVLRGYDRAAVDAYVAEVAQLVAELEATQLPETVVQRALDQVGEETSTILKRAHEAAEEIAARSRSQAAGRVERAESEAETTRREAEEDVRRLEEDARSIWQERSRLLDELRRLADEVLTVADDAGDRISPPARPPAAAPIDDQEPSGDELAGPIEEGPDEDRWTDESGGAPPEPSPDVEEDTAEHFPGPGKAPG